MTDFKPIDNDGTPLASQAQTVSYSDIWTTRDDAQRVPLNKAYAESSGYREVEEEPQPREGTYSEFKGRNAEPEPTQRAGSSETYTGGSKMGVVDKIKYGVENRIERAKANVVRTYDTTVENTKKAVTVENAKKLGKQIYTNVKTNLREDAGNLGKQGVSSVKNFGLTEKQSIRKYGTGQAPRFFSGDGGGFGDLAFSDKGNARKRAVGNGNPLDYFKKVSAPKVKGKNKSQVKKVKSIDFNSIGVVSSPFKTMSKTKNTSKRNNFDAPILENVDIFGSGSKRKKQSIGTLNVKPLSGTTLKVKPLTKRTAKINTPKLLKGSKAKYSNMNSLDGMVGMNIFGKKKKGGLF